MRKSFERNIYEYNKAAKDELRLRAENEPGDEKSVKELARLKSVVSWQTGMAADSRRTSKDVQKHVHDFQGAKQERFLRLKEDIAALDNPASEISRKSGAEQVTFEDDGYSVRNKDGSRSRVTLGELMTDGAWGLEYWPDGSIPRNVRKRFLIESAKREIGDLLDRQILWDEMGSKNTSPPVYQAYESRALMMDSEKEMPPGLVAEKMVDNFLKKITFVPGVSFEIIEADVHEDVYKKIDFIIRRKSDYRGVGVETTEGPAVGVQFVSTTAPEKIAQKEEQLRRANAWLNPEDRVKEIVLVSIPLADTKENYARWKRYPYPGGPEKLWDESVKKDVFKKVLAGMFTDEELEERWAKISPQV
ncbi:MAG: hypothetical protein Q7S36_01560 [Candidatus Liptonbacteria bacterium]|nr:hypothetical protein [Candidatus Liptonbacteria bacterium]